MWNEGSKVIKLIIFSPLGDSITDNQDLSQLHELAAGKLLFQEKLLH